MPRPRASYSAVEPQTGVTLYGVALVAVLLATIVGFGFGSGVSKAGAAELKPCQATNPTGPIINLAGELTVEPRRATRRAWKRAGVRQKLIKPANSFTGRPEFPVRKVRYGKATRVDLKGGIRMVRGKRKVGLRRLFVSARAGKPAWLRAKAGGRIINFLVVRGGKRHFNQKKGQLTRYGHARLTAAGAKLLNRRLKPAKKLRTGTYWGRFNLFSVYTVTEVEDPTGEIPEVPPVKTAPPGATELTGAATIKWFVRDSFIDYVATGQGTRAEDGATADPPSGPKNLSYSYNFPFDPAGGSWIIRAEDRENTLIKGKGTVGFRYCQNTINFTVSDPEIEIDGDDNSRMIFRVNGTDGTAFPNQRAVMVKLLPGEIEPDVTTVDGTTTVSYQKIPGFVPAEGTGLFAGLYPPYDPSFEGQNPRPDRFGFLTVTYSYPSEAP